MTGLVSTSLLFLLGQSLYASAGQFSSLRRDALPSVSQLDATTFSLNVSSCPGYTLTGLKETETSLSAELTFAGPACNAFGRDISNLTLEVTYESTTRKRHLTVLSFPFQSLHKNNSDLVFNFDPSPFAFWITRRSNPDAFPLFDTRVSSLPETPIPAVNANGTDGVGWIPIGV
ncbi:hypothetical protein QCA50_019132 [Cerrena zonata]|uniref:Uncharacterized protein n=1 Tax=Cerrena zonata TaxID=2478898 RepID=A0AAW0F9M2_9APHY